MNRGQDTKISKLLDLGPFHWRAVAPWRAARVAFGVIAPLTVGWMYGHIDAGAFAALGALPAGFASFEGVNRTRFAAVLAASLGMACSTFVGAAVGNVPWVLVPVVFIWGYVTGLMVCFGRVVSVAAVQGCAALMIAVGFPLGPADAAIRAFLVLGGGLLQGALVAASWFLRPGSHERAALAASYRALASYAREISAGRFGPPQSMPFPAAITLGDPNPLLSTRVHLLFLDLLEEAERLRAALAALAAHAADSPEQREELRSLSADSAVVLGLISDAMRGGSVQRTARLSELSKPVAALSVPAAANWRWAGEALLGRLRAVIRTMADVDALPTPLFGNITELRPELPRLADAAMALTTLRANLTLSTEAGRHALRLATVATIAEVLVQAVGLSQGRWVVLTILLVLKPDYSATLFYGIHRALGTALGAALGVLAAYLGGLDQGGLITIAGISIAAAYALFDVNYLLFSISLTVFILVNLDILGVPAIPTAEARLVDTAIGSAMALIAYMVWPTWEGGLGPEKFARLLESHAAYVAALLREIAHPGEIGSTRILALQIAARRARSDAEASAARLADEPADRAPLHAVAAALIAAVRRLARAELTLHALLPLRDAAPDQYAIDRAVVPGFDALAAAIDTALHRLGVAIMNREPPEPIPALRPVHVSIREASQNEDRYLIVTITDSMVDAVDTIDAIVRRWATKGER